MDGLARLRHVACIRGVARQLQREIRFAGGVQLRRAAGINRPAAIGKLPVAHIICQLGNALRISLPKNMQIVDVIRFEGGVCFELALPESFLSLQGKKVIRATLDGVFQARCPLLVRLQNRSRSDGNFFSHSGE